jgi:hypothetical protein
MTGSGNFSQGIEGCTKCVFLPPEYDENNYNLLKTHDMSDTLNILYHNPYECLGK